MAVNNQRLSEKTGIREKVIEEIQELAVEYKIEKVILFGSRARGDYRERSDIDLAVYGKDCARFSLDVDDLTTTFCGHVSFCAAAIKKVNRRRGNLNI